MKSLRIITILSAAIASFLLNSCGGGCCTGEALAPPLRPLPNFGHISGSK